jgi:hypothetical protein
MLLHDTLLLGRLLFFEGPFPAEKAFDGIGRADVAMHHWWKGIKRQVWLIV